MRIVQPQVINKCLITQLYLFFLWQNRMPRDSGYSRKILAGLYQATDNIISGSRILERIQSELGKNRNKMFHDFRLDRFITRPVLICRKTINLQGQAILCRGQCTYHQQQVLTDKRMTLQIKSQIGRAHV